MVRQLPFAEPGPDWHWGMFPNEESMNPGWHVAKDKSWFVSYAPLSEVYAYPDDDENPNEILKVAGVGTVMLKLPSNHPRGPRTLHLLKVLHIPEIKYGIICNKQLEKTERRKFSIDVKDAAYPNGVVRDKNTGEVVAIFDGNSPAPERPDLVVSLHDISRSCSKGSAMFEDMFSTGECWAQWVMVKEDDRHAIDEANDNCQQV